MNNKTDPVSNGVKKTIVLVTLITLFSFWGGPIGILSGSYGVKIFAQETELPDPGLTPDSPFYFLERISETIGTFFTFGGLKKAERYTKLAAERIAETQAVVEKGKPEKAQTAIKRYEDQLEKALARVEKAKTKGKSIEKITETVTQATSQQLAVLEQVLEKAPEQAKEAITKAREVSINSQKNALRALAWETPERAFEINLKAVEDRLNKAKAKAEEGETEEVEEAIREFENQHKFGEEISQIAQGLGKDTTTIEQLVGKVTSIHLEVLAEVYEKVPEQAKPAIEKAMTVSAKGHERAIEALKEKGALDGTQIPEEPPLPPGVPKEVSERVRERAKEEIKEMECLDLGKEINPSLPPEYSNLGKECCQGLKLIPVKQWFDENCNRRLIVGAGSVCAPCGNGVCDEKYENICNCPEDCPKVERTKTEEAECLKEGETYMPGEDKQCCAGLEKMTITYGDGKVCTLPMGYVCTAFCGDGKCQGEYENACSCPKDCSPAAAAPTVPMALDIDVSTTAGKPYTIGWKAVSEATNYILERDINSSFSNPIIVSSRTLNSFSGTLSPSVSTRYYFRVKACNKSGCSSWSKTTMLWVEVIVPSPSPPPSPSPSPPEEKITVNSPNGGEVWKVGNTYTIFWESTVIANGLTKVRINLLSQKKDDPSTYKVANIASDVDVTKGFYSWQIPTEMPCVSLPCLSFSDYPCHKIEIVDSRYGRDSQVTKVISDESNGCFTIIKKEEVCSVPQTPVLTDSGISVNNNESFILNWTNIAGAKGYWFQRGYASPSFSEPGWYSEVNSVTQTFSLGASTTYYYRVKACNDCGCSSWSNVVDMRVEVRAVFEAPVLTDPGTSVKKHEAFTLNWTSVKGVKRYWLQRDTSTNFSIPAWICETNSDTDNPGIGTSDPEVTTTYYYRVKACDDQRCSAWSNVVDMEVVVDILAKCYGITDNAQKISCYAQVAIANNQPSICDQVPIINGPDWCYLEVVQTIVDETICQNVKAASNRDNCYNNVAKKKQDETICELAGGLRDTCYIELAKVKKDPNLCEKVAFVWQEGFLDLKGSCYFELAKIKNDPNLCDKISYQGMRNNCYSFFPSITVISPNGGETWVIENSYDITWESKGIDKVLVDIYKEDKLFDSLIITSANLGKCSWTVYIKTISELPGDKYKIRVSDYDHPGIYDQSDSYFSILPSPPPEP